MGVVAVLICFVLFLKLWFFETGSYFVTQAGLKLLPLLPQSPSVVIDGYVLPQSVHSDTPTVTQRLGWNQWVTETSLRTFNLRTDICGLRSCCYGKTALYILEH